MTKLQRKALILDMQFCSTCGVSLMVVGHLSPPKDGEDKLPDNAFNVGLHQIFSKAPQ